MRRTALIALGCGLLIGCSSTPLQSDGQIGAEQVMRRIKDELSEYFVYMHAHENDAALANACQGQIDFKIKSVTVTMVAMSDQSADVNGSASLPIGGPGTLGPSLDLTRDAKSTSTMKYTFYPVDPGPAAVSQALETSGQWEGFPIASSLEQLRESLLKASDTRPCLVFTGPDDPGPPVKKGTSADQTVTFDFNVVRTVKGGLTFKFVLFSVGASGTAQRQAENSVQVTFNAMPGNAGFAP